MEAEAGEKLPGGGTVAHRYISLPGVRLHYVEAGAGPPVILLHGFPDFWYSWRNQIPALAASGFRVIAPDLRGYNLSGKPRGVSAYRVEHLAGDIASLVRSLGVGRVALGGHDWGAAVAWHCAMRFPDLLDRLLILNVPHPERMARGLRTLRQLRKSWYIFAFQPPRLPEHLLRARDFAVLRRTLQDDPCQPDAFTPGDIERYVEAWRQPGALTAAVNYYRSLLRFPSELVAHLERIERPVQVIWGEHDRYLGRELAIPSPRWVPNARVAFVPEASHWVQHDCPRRVNELMLAFLRQ